jgi:hypothetical protein
VRCARLCREFSGMCALFRHLAFSFEGAWL